MNEMAVGDRGPYINRQSPIDLPLISDLSILILSFVIETDLWVRVSCANDRPAHPWFIQGESRIPS